MTTRQALISLNRVQGIGAVKTQQLEAAFGTLEAASTVSVETFRRQSPLGALTEKAYAALHSNFAAEEEARAASLSVKLITWDDDDYPPALKEIPSPPLVLYVVGPVKLLSQPQIAIVGTRRASIYGTEQTQRFALALAQAGIHVTSGLAEGIDTAAHEGAMSAGPLAEGKTIAVVGAALDTLYPASRKPLARQIVHAGGCVVSEYPFGRHADAQTFPMRNRIVAALSKGLLVAEAPVHSGTLITVDYASQFGRVIYVLPGRVDAHSFGGNLALLRSGVGRVVTCPAHILDDFSELDLREGHAESYDAEPVGLNPDELAVYKAVKEEPCNMDELVERTGLNIALVMSITISLQMRKLLRPQADGSFRA